MSTGKTGTVKSNVASEREPETRHCHSNCFFVFSGWNHIYMINKREILKYFENQKMRAGTL